MSNPMIIAAKISDLYRGQSYLIKPDIFFSDTNIRIILLKISVYIIFNIVPRYAPVFTGMQALTKTLHRTTFFLYFVGKYPLFCIFAHRKRF